MPPARTYLDYAATTPLDPRVLEAMLPFFSGTFGNPSSLHTWGQEAERAVEASRARVAEILGCRPEEILFTSGGSESDNLALRGLALAERLRRGARHILTSPVEHDAVLRTARQLADLFGFEWEVLRVDAYGRVSPEDLSRQLRPDTAVVSVIYANNEIGTINPLADLGEVCRRAGVPFHTDAIQAASQLALGVDSLKVDCLSLGGHKFYGPKGVGALYLRTGWQLIPSLTGGGQEGGWRAGTHNVPLIVGFSSALALTQAEREAHNAAFRRHRDRLWNEVPARVGRCRPTGHPAERLPNHASFVFHEVDGNALLAALDQAGFGCSSGSACRTGDPEPSQVLLAIGLPRDWALGSLRVTVGRPTVESDVERLLQALPALIDRLRRARRGAA
jgi:cysteine desulfurase